MSSFDSPKSGLVVVMERLFSLKLKDYSWKNNKIKYSFILITAILCVALKFIAIPIVILIYVLLSIIENQFVKKDI